MKFGILKSKVDKRLLESYSNQTLQKELKTFKKLVLENSNISKLFYLYDELRTNQGLNESVLDDYINECSKIYETTINKIKPQSIEKIKREQSENNPLFKLIRHYGYARELPLIIATLKAFSRGKVRITEDKQIVDASDRPINGYDLTAEIDAAVKDSLPQ